MTRIRRLVRTLPLLAGVTAGSAVLATAAGPVAHAASAVPPTMPADPLTVVDAGDPATQVVLTDTLPGEGLVVTTDTTVHSAATTTISTGTPYALEEVADASYDVTMTMHAPAPDGTFSAAATVDAFTASATTSDPGGALDPTPMTLEDHGVADLTAAIGVPFVQTFGVGRTATGALPAEGSAPTPEQEAALGMLMSENGRFVLTVPDTAVGAGATWTYTAPFFDGMVTTYELVSVAGDQFTITASSRLEVPPFGDPFVLDGRTVASTTVTSSAEFSGTIGQPFNRTSAVNTTTELEFADGAGTVIVVTDATRTSTAVEPAG